MSTSKATARPWRVGDAGTTVFGPPNGNPSPKTIATISYAKLRGVEQYDESAANAALIVRAVNSHEALVAALRDLLDGSEPWDVRATQARAALALAEQGGG